MDKKLIDPLKLGLNLKKYIKTIGYKVKDIQNYLCLECPQPIYRWFKGSTYPSIHHLYALSCLFGVSMNELVEESDERKEWGNRIYQIKRKTNLRKARNFVSVFLAYFLVFKYDIDTL